MLNRWYKCISYPEFPSHGKCWRGGKAENSYSGKDSKTKGIHGGRSYSKYLFLLKKIVIGGNPSRWSEGTVLLVRWLVCWRLLRLIFKWLRFESMSSQERGFSACVCFGRFLVSVCGVAYKVPPILWRRNACGGFGFHFSHQTPPICLCYTTVRHRHVRTSQSPYNSTVTSVKSWSYPLLYSCTRFRSNGDVTYLFTGKNGLWLASCSTTKMQIHL